MDSSFSKAPAPVRRSRTRVTPVTRRRTAKPAEPRRETREEQKRSRERRIVSAARRLFAQNGLEKTAMGQVAGAAGLAVGTIYNYFPSKNDLLLAILKRETERTLKAGRRLIAAPPPDPVLAIAALAETFVDGFANDDRGLWRELLGAAFLAPRTIGARLFESDFMLITQMTALIEELKRRGRLAPATDAGRAAMCIYSLCFTWLMAYLMTDEFPLATMRQEIRHGIRLVVNGMLAHPRQALAKKGERG